MYNSCFVATNEELEGTNHKFVFGVDFGEKVFVHAIYIEQDKYDGNIWNHSETTEYLQNFEVYIGDSEVYSENKKCPGGPFMKLNDLASYTYDGYLAAMIFPNNNDPNGQGVGMAWNYGAELWCN